MEMRGCSLANDLKFLINNINYSDLKIICQDELSIYGNRAILAARSIVLDRLLFNGMKESTINEIKFPEINHNAMEIILEYLYTEKFESESLSLENCIEAYHAADYFQLEQLQQKVVNFVKISLKECQQSDVQGKKLSLAPKLLTKAVEKMSPLADNEMIQLLIEWIAKTPLEVIGFDKLSFQALQCLLSQTYSTQIHFVSSEYTVFRYAVIQAANNVSENAISILEERLPNWNDLNKIREENPENNLDENKYEEIRSSIKELLSTILPFIDLRRIDVNILADIIEPLRLIPTSHLLDAYRFQAREKKSLPHMRGVPLFEWNLQWEKCSKGSSLILKENNSVVESVLNAHQNIRANNLISGEGIYEWKIILEETCVYAWIGVCSERGLDNNIFAGQQTCAWVLGSSGRCYHNNMGLQYAPEFTSGAIIIVHLDMTERSISFSINGVMHPPVSIWNNLPSRLYPVVSISSPGRIRLGSVRDWNHIHYKNQSEAKIRK